MLLKLLGKRSTSSGEWVDCIIDRNLAILMVQPGVDILAAFLNNLLAKNDGLSGSIDEKVVFWHIDVWSHSSTAIVTEMEDPSLDTKPEKLETSRPQIEFLILPLEITAEGDGDMAARFG